MTSFNLISIFLEASFLLKLILLSLLGFSIFSWSIIILLWMQQRSIKVQDAAVIQLLEQHQTVGALHPALEGSPSGSQLGEAIAKGLHCFRCLYQAHPILEPALLQAEGEMQLIIRSAAELPVYWMSWLSTISATTPYIGLFGTVWGIMQTFSKLAGAQTASLQMVAPGIAEALIATAIALFTAIPAAIGQHRFAAIFRQIEARQMHWIETTVGRLRNQLLSVSRHAARP